MRAQVWSFVLCLAFLVATLAVLNWYEAKADAMMDRLLSEPYDKGIAEDC